MQTFRRQKMAEQHITWYTRSPFKHTAGRMDMDGHQVRALRHYETQGNVTHVKNCQRIRVLLAWPQ